MEEKDINRLWATGNYDPINELLLKIIRSLKVKICVSSLNYNGNVALLELSFLSSDGFPKDIFGQITKEIPNNDNVYIRILSDELDCDHNKEYIFEHGKWSFNKHNIDLTKKAPVSTLTRYSDDKYAYTTGAFLQRISYINVSGKRVFGWIVTGFEGETFRNDEELNVCDMSYTLEGLTPPENQEEILTETIIKTLTTYGLHEMGDDLYRKYTDEAYVTLDVRKLDCLTEAGVVTQIISTLDEFLLNASEFTQDAREILVETFGRDRTDIFTSDKYPLIIGSCRANIWAIAEYEDKELKENDELAKRH